MFQLLINPFTIFLALTTTLGVVVHDTRIDKVASDVLGIPAAVATYASADAAMKLSEQHTHTERVSLSFEQPRTQARGADDKKYIVTKKLNINSYGSDYSWPSV